MATREDQYDEVIAQHSGAADAILAALSCSAVSLRSDAAEFSWIPTKPWVNIVGGVFGGALSAVADMFAGFAVMANSTPRPANLPTISLHVDYLRPLTPDVEYRVIGHALRVGKRIAVADVTFESPDGVLVARASVTMAVVRATT